MTRRAPFWYPNLNPSGNHLNDAFDLSFVAYSLTTSVGKSYGRGLIRSPWANGGPGKAIFVDPRRSRRGFPKTDDNHDDEKQPGSNGCNQWDDVFTVNSTALDSKKGQCQFYLRTWS